MKLSILVLSALFAASTVLAAGAEPAVSKGSAHTYTLSGAQDQAALVIKGDAAQKIYEDMSDDLVSTLDASENNGAQTVMKNGENITCYMTISTKGKRKYDCEINIDNKSSGKIGPAAVG